MTTIYRSNIYMIFIHQKVAIQFKEKITQEKTHQHKNKYEQKYEIKQTRLAMHTVQTMQTIIIVDPCQTDFKLWL